MAIVSLSKLTLYGAESNQDAVISKLQELECAHLIDLGHVEEEYASSMSDDAYDALRFLRDCPEQRRQVRRNDHFDCQQVVADTLELLSETRDCSDERDELRKAIDDLHPWGEFRLPTAGLFGDLQFWFYSMPLRDVAKIPHVSGRAVHEVARDHGNAYVLLLSREEPDDVPGTRWELDPRPLSELRRRLEDVEECLAELYHRRVGLTRWCDLLAGTFDEYDDAAAREKAKRLAVQENNVFALQAWIPSHAVDRILNFAAENQLAARVEPPSDDEVPPTLLENPERLAGSESLVTFYKTPDYHGWDPSIVVNFSFAVFFAMIFADAGYGVVLAMFVGYFWKRMGKTRGGRRTRNVLATIFGFTIVYGVLCGSYFGVSPRADSFLGRLRLLDAQRSGIDDAVDDRDRGGASIARQPSRSLAATWERVGARLVGLGPCDVGRSRSGRWEFC